MRLGRSLLLLATLAITACSSSAEDPSEDVSGAAEARDPMKVFTINKGKETGQPGAKPDAINAYWLARMSEIAYQEKLLDRAEALVKIGAVPSAYVDRVRAAHKGDEAAMAALTSEDSEVQLASFENAGAEAMYFRNKDVAVLAFKGTESAFDVAVDAYAVRKQSKLLGGEAYFHGGFFRIFKQIWYGKEDNRVNLRQFIANRHGSNAKKPVPLYITGHSLGGALAHLAVGALILDDCLEAMSAAQEQAEREGRKDLTPAEMAKLGELTTVYTAKRKDGTCGPALEPGQSMHVCKKPGIPVAGLYTYGSPRVADARVTANWIGEELVKRKIGTYRFVNETDFVTRVPATLTGWSHASVNYNENAFLVYLAEDGSQELGARPFKLPCLNKDFKCITHLLGGYVSKLERIARGEAKTKPAPWGANPPQPLENTCTEYTGM